jgi:UDPglucose 6-dehydrogenase
MLNSIGYIGYGFVGKACHKAFEHNSEAIIIDPKHSETTWDEFALYRPRLTFVSINAPTLDDGSVDASVIYTIFQQLADIKYDGLVVLKSTLPPNIVCDLYDKFAIDGTMSKSGFLRYIYSPEFLREAQWEKDAISPALMILAGNFHDCKELEMMYKNHSHIPQYCRFFLTNYDEAALAKYTINAFLAMKVTFMNQIYQVYADGQEGKEPHPEMWKAFTDMLSADLRFGSSHLNVPGPDGQYGYGGTCFPKDMKAFIGYDKNERLSLLREVEEANTKIRLTGSGQIK